MQVAIVAGTTFVFVEILAACLFLITRDINNNGYYPSSGMVTLCHASPGATLHVAVMFRLARKTGLQDAYSVLPCKIHNMS